MACDCASPIVSFSPAKLKFGAMEVLMKKVVIIGAVLWLLSLCGYAQQNKNAPPPGKKDHVFKGKVEKIDLSAKTFTVNGEKVEGWMDSMTMVYVPDKEDVLKKVKVGDQITAKVYDGDFRVLHDVQVAAPPADGKAEKKGPPKK